MMITMIRNILLTMFVLAAAHNSIGQEKGSLHFGTSNGFSYFHGSSKVYMASDVQFGYQFEVMSGYLKTYGAYQLYGNMKEENFDAYTFASHLLGVGAEFQSNSDKQVDLIVGISLMTEVYTNFKNGYINRGDIALPVAKKIYEYEYYATNFEKSYLYYPASHYQGTPLNASLWLGMNFKVFESFNISFSIANDIRIMNEKYFKWDMTDKEEETVNLVGKDFNELIDQQQLSRTVVDKLSLRLGLSYTLPLSKTK